MGLHFFRSSKSDYMKYFSTVAFGLRLTELWINLSDGVEVKGKRLSGCSSEAINFDGSLNLGIWRTCSQEKKHLWY